MGEYGYKADGVACCGAKALCPANKTLIRKSIKKAVAMMKRAERPNHLWRWRYHQFWAKGVGAVAAIG
jgi:hypothetical protein